MNREIANYQTELPAQYNHNIYQVFGLLILSFV